MEVGFGSTSCRRYQLCDRWRRVADGEIHEVLQAKHEARIQIAMKNECTNGIRTLGMVGDVLVVEKLVFDWVTRN
jgi:hypothetical protein